MSRARAATVAVNGFLKNGLNGLCLVEKKDLI